MVIVIFWFVCIYFGADVYCVCRGVGVGVIFGYCVSFFGS